MDIILDSNIYSMDYRFAGVSFKTLFDYIRRTQSKLVLPRIIREEVVSGFGRRLKKESKEFYEIYRRYKLLDIDDRLAFRKPDIRKAMTGLRRKLMRPSENIVPIYVPKTNDVHVDDVFMRGVHRSRPANEQGEELRDVIIWLWVLGYSAGVVENVAFVSQDTAFWSGDEPHSQIANDIRPFGSRLSVYRNIDEFVKKNAPAPVEITPKWFSSHFEPADFDRETVAAATKELSRSLTGILRDVRMDGVSFVRGLLYEVAAGVQFAELQLSVSFSFTRIALKQELPGFRPAGPLGFSQVGLRAYSTLFDLRGDAPSIQGILGESPNIEPQSEPRLRHLKVSADAKFTSRINNDVVGELSLEELIIDKKFLFSEMFAVFGT